jgi:hypothetical protein
VLRIHQIKEVKFIDSPNEDQHELVGHRLLLDPLTDIIV